VEFALAGPGEVQVGATPFVSLAETGRFSRVLLARLADGAGRTLQLLACKLQRDVYRGIGSTAAPRLDNRAIEDMWARERANLELLAGRGAPLQLAVVPGHEPLPPLAYDPERRALFPVLAPGSFAPLEVCRDDQLLHAAGLEPWSQSLQRHLYCPGDPRTFYVWSQQDGSGRVHAAPEDGVRLLRGTDLYVELLRSWRALDDAHRAELAVRWPDGAAAMAALPAADAARRLVPFCFHPAHALLLEFQDLHFDELCDLAGGASTAQLAAAAQRSGTAGRCVAFARIAPRLDQDGQWWSAPWTRGDAPDGLGDLEAERLRRFAVEAALLKLQAFAQVCRAVHQYHAQLQQPHLGLSPDNVMARLGVGPAGAAPARWCFEVAVVDVGCSHRMELSGLGGAGSLPELFRPGFNVARAFVSPLTEFGRAAPELSVQATARRLDGGDGLRLELHATQDRFGGVQPGDVLRVLADGPLPGLRQSALLGLVAAVGEQDRSLVVEVRLDPDQRGGLPDHEFAFAAAATWHRRLQTPCDMFSLGMLLVRALLCHDQRDVFAVREVWDRVIDKFELMLSARRADARQAQAAMEHLLDGERAHLGSESVLFAAAVRNRVQAPLPPGLWRELLLLMARLLTSRPGFSFAGHHSDLGGRAPADLVAAVLAETEELLARLQDELQDAVRGAEIADIATELLAEISAAMVNQAGGQA
jgi:hypothetical protein